MPQAYLLHRAIRDGVPWTHVLGMYLSPSHAVADDSVEEEVANEEGRALRVL
eukprot:CAMPEP_0119539376 /NCGR_PEP_ID=MMETSP1344-20130328/51539_1 /TAXON_ID=236787 /ORGANISM="Florenciella parvula, Strain CCMP2471" /LENGTH=51 /DNA_ID=CAMNT_0007582637 /DNA_START=87 /DNA_END=239 /DNA_ORIENTATION=+